MHQTTIRFSPDTWSWIEREARAEGVSAAHYVREAVSQRLAAAEARRAVGQDPSARRDAETTLA